jgi:hypothetical protein
MPAPAGHPNLVASAAPTVAAATGFEQATVISYRSISILEERKESVTAGKYS